MISFDSILAINNVMNVGITIQNQYVNEFIGALCPYFTSHQYTLLRQLHLDWQ